MLRHRATPTLSRAVGLTAAACLLWGHAVVAQPPEPPAGQPTGVITGRVIAATTDLPIPGADITVRGQEVRATAATDGRFVLRGVRIGIVALEVRAVGYRPVIIGDIAVSPAKPAEVTVHMRPVEQQLQAVTVRPERFPVLPPALTPVSTQTYRAEEVRRQPGAQEDVLRAVSVAPGVGVTVGGRNDLVVRGGAPFENLFVVDNIEVPNINHFGSQGSTGGPLSLINIRFVESASLSAGGFGARYGDRASSATVLTLREGNAERIAGEVNVSASQFGAVVEGPIGDRITFLANVRQSYLDLLFKAFGFSFIPEYTDATVKAVWRPTDRDVVSALVIGARGTVTFNNDSADNRLDNARILSPSQDQYFSGLTWKRSLARGSMTSTFGRTWTRFATAQRDTLLVPVFENRSTEGETSARVDGSWVVSPTLTLDGGTNVRYASRLRYDVTLAGFVRRDATGVPRPLRADTTFTALRNGSYVQASWQAAPRVRLVGGVRGDWYGFLNNAVRVAPRLSATVQLDDATALTVAGGQYWQAPSFIWLVGAPTNAQTVKPLRADQVVVGVQRRLTDDTKVQFEVYGKRYANYPSRVFRPQAVLSPSGFDDASTDIPFGLEPLGAEGRGSAYGAELFVQQSLGALPIYGQASISLNRTTFRGIDGTEARGAFDTPVIANALLGWRPNARWELATRIRGASGLPTTPFITEGPLAGALDFARYNSGRRGAFFAADIRVDRRFTVRGQQLIAFFDVQNVTNYPSRGDAQWNPRTRSVEQSTGAGRLPTIGLNWEF